MRQFKYEAIDAAGADKSGILGAVDETEANHKIRQEGYFVTKIQEVFTDHRAYDTIPTKKYKFEFKMTGFIIGFIIGTIITLILRCLT